MESKTIEQQKLLANNRGTTLVETMVVVLIFSLLAGSFYSVAQIGDNSWQVNRIQIELQQELRKSMDAMVNDLRQAGNASIVNVPADGNWYNTITFRIPQGVAGGNINWTTNTIQFVRGGTGNEQLRRIFGAQTKIISQHISSMQFRRFATSSDTLEVALQAQADTIKGTTLNYDLNFSVQLRN